MKRLVLFSLLALTALAADRIATPYDSIRAILPQLAPPELRAANARAFNDWARDQDKRIRARLDQGDLDSLVNLLLFGTSFTTQPRMTIENLAEESRAGLLRNRLIDLMEGLKNPGGNERLAYLRGLLIQLEHPPEDSYTGTYILDNLRRVLLEKIEINERIERQSSSAGAFSRRGVSLDATILPNYGIDLALQQLKASGTLGTVAQAAIAGPGLDFIDKESGFDYYPQQTLQPFALQDSLARLELAAKPRITILDISPRVLGHVQAARKRPEYTIQLPRNTGANWTGAAIAYWNAFGSATGQPAEPLPTPPSLTGVATRAVHFPTPNFETADVNIVSQRLSLSEKERFELVIATNILVYYTPFEQALALANIAAMLKPGGLLLTNDLLPELPEIPMQRIGQTAVAYAENPQIGDTIYWYRRP